MQTARLESVNAIPPGADASLSHQLERLVGPLKEQDDLVSGLSTSASTSGVARSARRLHRLYSQAGRSLAGLQARPRDRRAVVALANALAAEAGGFEDLAQGADAHHEATYEAAAVSVEASSHAVRANLRWLRRIGFATVPLLPLFSVPPLPTVESMPAAPGELVHIPERGSGDAPVVGAEELAEAPGEEEWEEAEEVGKGSEEGAAGKTPKQRGEAAEPVEAQGAR